MTARTVTYATLTNTSGNAWLIKSRSGDVWGAIHADGVDAAMAAAKERIAVRLPSTVTVDQLTPVNTAEGCYSLRRVA